MTSQITLSISQPQHDPEVRKNEPCHLITLQLHNSAAMNLLPVGMHVPYETSERPKSLCRFCSPNYPSDKGRCNEQFQAENKAGRGSTNVNTARGIKPAEWVQSCHARTSADSNAL